MTIITTQRLIIRHFKEEDAAALFDYLSSPRTPCFKDEKLHSLLRQRSTWLNEPLTQHSLPFV